MKIQIKKNKLLIFVVGVLLILSLNLFQAEVKNFIYSVSQPIQQRLWQVGGSVSDFFGVIPKLKEIEKEREELDIKNQELMAELVALRKAQEENVILREALDVGLAKDFQLEMAEVIGKDLSQDALIINKGFQDGLAEDMPVVNQQKVLLGRISQVYKDYAKVMLIFDKNSSIEAEILSGGSGTSISGIIRGLGGGRAYIDLLPREEDIIIGELVVSSSLGGVFPSGLLIGLIEEVQKIDTDPFQKGEVSLFFDLSELKKVFVILDF